MSDELELLKDLIRRLDNLERKFERLNAQERPKTSDMVGPAGPAGATGATGATGPQGYQGVAGSCP